MNKCVLLGRLVRDPNVTTTQTGMTIARMTIAVNRKGKAKEGQPTADFINIVAFDKTAEFAGKYLAKGRQILVEGRIQTSSYEKDGQKIFRTDIICDGIEFADSKPTSGGNAKSNAGSDDELPF